MLIVVDFAVTFVVVFVSTAVAMDCVMFVHKIVVVEELSVTVIVRSEEHTSDSSHKVQSRMPSSA